MNNQPALLSLVCTVALVISAPALSQGFPESLAQAATKLADYEPVPVFLPTVIPSVISKYGIKRTDVTRGGSGYTVSLYYSKQASDATFAGMVAGSSSTFSSLPNTSNVKLANGTTALFRAVSCGGSCAPANLWWQMDGFEYQLQLKLASNLSKAQQRHALIEMANSMARVHSRAQHPVHNNSSKRTR